jgi:hypothetical protein
VTELVGSHGTISDFHSKGASAPAFLVDFFIIFLDPLGEIDPINIA